MELVLAAFACESDPLFVPTDRSIAQAGYDILLTYMAFMRRVEQLPDLLVPTHPSIDMRLQRRGRFLNQLPEGARTLAVAAENLFADFSGVVAP